MSKIKELITKAREVLTRAYAGGRFEVPIPGAPVAVRKDVGDQVRLVVNVDHLTEPGLPAVRGGAPR